MNGRSYAWLACVALVIGSWSAVALGQTSAPAATAPSAVGQVDIYVKIVGAAFTAVATLIGLPVVFLTYRKTQAEIAKLELEAKALRDKHTQEPGPPGGQGGIRVAIDHSPNASVRVMADPRFLAPLLVLLDFIFASIVLTLAGHLFSIIRLEFLEAPALAVLAAVLLMPIGRQVLRVRTVLRPPQTAEELEASQRQSRVAFSGIYLILSCSSLLLGVLVLNVQKASLTEPGRYLGWALLSGGILLTGAFPLARRRFVRYLGELHEADTGARNEA